MEGCTCPVADCLVHDEWYWRERRIADTPDDADTTPLSAVEKLRVRLIGATKARCFLPPAAPGVEWGCDPCGTVFHTVQVADGTWQWAVWTEDTCLHDDEWVVIWRYPDGTIDCATCGDRLALRGEWDAAPEIRTTIRVL